MTEPGAAPETGEGGKKGTVVIDTDPATLPLKIYSAPPQEDNSDIGGRYIRGCPGDIVEARRRWELTKQWRKEYKTDQLLFEPQPHFALIKRYYQHYIIGKCKAGHFVWVERPGKSRVSKIYEADVALDDLCRHYVFVSEFLWNVIDPNDESMALSLFDCEGCGMGFLAGKTMELFKTTSKVIQMHYPERSYKMIVINAPWWFKTVWALISPLLDPRTKEKIVILGSDYKAKLLEYLDESEVPVEYGGTDERPLGMGREELILWQHVKEVNERNGVGFTPDPADASTSNPGWDLSKPPGIAEPPTKGKK
mmetsp:Transcript_9037/g.17692  ORF Transcript_9037/g.17692 Transcript_9037/m.17692 type:complete len:309 (-) Transcript_9037:402-1328(-)